MQAALKVINDALKLMKGQHLETTLKNANKIVQKEWFKVSSTESAHPHQVEDYLDYFEEFSPDLLKFIVNLTDANVSHFMRFSAFSRGIQIKNYPSNSKIIVLNPPTYTVIGHRIYE